MTIGLKDANTWIGIAGLAIGVAADPGVGLVLVLGGSALLIGSRAGLWIAARVRANRAAGRSCRSETDRHLGSDGILWIVLRPRFGKLLAPARSTGFEIRQGEVGPRQHQLGHLGGRVHPA